MAQPWMLVFRVFARVNGLHSPVYELRKELALPSDFWMQKIELAVYTLIKRSAENRLLCAWAWVKESDYCGVVRTVLSNIGLIVMIAIRVFEEVASTVLCHFSAVQTHKQRLI